MLKTLSKYLYTMQTLKEKALTDYEVALHNLSAAEKALADAQEKYRAALQALNGEVLKTPPVTKTKKPQPELESDAD